MSNTTGRAVLGLIAAAGLFAGVATPALAQQATRIVMNMSDGPMGGGGAISKRSIERYAEVLGFGDEQKESALVIHEGYQAGMKDVARARSSAIEDINRSAQDSGDHSVFMEKMPTINKEFREKEVKLEKSLMDDLRALCSGGAQEGRWSKVERMRRREVELRRGSVSGEAMDLIEIVHNLKLAPDALAPIAAALDEYETEIDGQIKNRQKVQSDAPAFKPGEPPDMEAMKKSMADSREAGLKIKGVNERFAKRIEGALPEEKQAAFRKAARAAMFPQVYRRSPITRDLDKALALKDLTSEQRETLTGLKASYERDSRPINDAWASAIESSDKEDKNSGMMTGAGGGGMMIRMGDEAQAVKDARKARRDLDDKARQTIKNTLNEAQQTAIKPQPGEGGEEGVEVMGEALMIRATR
jgi:hypothetical protein